MRAAEELTPSPQVAAVLATAAPARAQVDSADVRRVLSVLSDDSMAGRAAFTPDADRAARFIAHEFDAIGLRPFHGASGYLQPFETAYGIAERVAQGRVQMVGTSGTVTTLTGILLDLPRYNRNRVDGTHLTFADLQRATGRLAGLAVGRSLRR